MPRIETRFTLEDYMREWGDMYNDGELWDFSEEDFNGGAIEIDEDCVYWLIDGRYYETAEMIENESLYERFILEPRAESKGFRTTSASWLVAYDTKIKNYVKEPGTRRMMRFGDSKTAFEWLKENCSD